ncbi:sulfite exporter TauE/SafE family protein [Streptomyces nodosus]|uniref:Probable membrane transporter protein n=1 Tax=Streptomyces nodosus TaxID=40318 RepID=A0A0B5DKM3_9ACTN|nr:TSUP family transporter [Streptomyces nodosus]AJE40572.1 membrane protein [Streptomyces nodosus]MBB4791623.1 putative membrane protein YfcA [Streptomyces nodosus]QEV39132.1 sulfite exporter TauE/SafE family protein [Streptomyces nodosus]
MPDISLTMVVVLCLAALGAGWIDAVVGGGGLLLLPALLLGLPGNTPGAYALGTNKAVAIVGTTGAAVTYVRSTPVDVRTAVRIGLAALVGSMAGAFVAVGLSTDVLKPVVMVVLLGVGAFVLLRPAFGTVAPSGPVSARRVLAAIGLAGLGIGFYDGLIGPGTGTFLVLALTAILHLDLVSASATAKIVNCCTNVGALATFAWQGTVFWQLAALMAVFNLAGGMVGARTALKKGSGFVRIVLLTVVFALVVNLAYQQWVA